MPKSLEEFRSSSKRLAEEVKAEARGFFTKSPRDCLCARRKIVIDPASFIIGGLGAVAVGSIADESNERNDDTSSATIFAKATVRTILYPLRNGVRFFSGGCIYVGVDSLMLYTFQRRSPMLAGAATGLCFATGARLNVLLGSMLGMALFAYAADIFAENVINNGWGELY